MPNEPRATSSTRFYVFDAHRNVYLEAGSDARSGLPPAASDDEWTRDRTRAVSYTIHSHAVTALLRRMERYPALAIVAIARTSRTRQEAVADDTHDTEF